MLASLAKSSKQLYELEKENYRMHACWEQSEKRIEQLEEQALLFQLNLERSGDQTAVLSVANRRLQERCSELTMTHQGIISAAEARERVLQNEKRAVEDQLATTNTELGTTKVTPALCVN